MPKLNKIRITGNKYDGFQKQHKNSIFDLTHAGEADHTLFTLQNGSGKGVMLQLISQIMLPGTAWGRNNGNKVAGMFYNRFDVFKPYTFHVVLEWNLEHDAEKILLTGICVSAETLDKDGKVGLDYFLYTHEYKGDSKFRLENLPLYFKSEEKVLSYEEMEEYIEENDHAFRKFSKTSASNLNSDYYQYLASHGLYRSEWEIMKTINRSEGGLDKYFSRAKDNQDLFDKLIIPAVSESINAYSNENEDSLLKMFVNNVKIAKDLPELISRTEDIKKLLTMVEPLMTDSEHGVKLKEKRDKIRERGNNYLKVLENRKVDLQNELQRTKSDKKSTKKQIKKLKFQRQNLKYARKVRELQEIKSEQAELKQKLNNVEKTISELKTEEKKLQLNKHYLSYQQYQKQYEQKKRRINELKESSELTNLREKIETQKQKIKNNWPKLKEKWEKSSSEMSGYLQHLEDTEKQLYQEQKNLNNKIKEKEMVIEKYKDRKNNLEKKKEKLLDKYNSLQLSTPGYLAEKLSAKLEKEENKLQKWKEKRTGIEEKIENLRAEKEKLNINLVQKEDSYKNVKEKYQDQKSREEDISASIINLLNLDKYKEVYNNDWLKDKKNEVEKLLIEKKNQVRNLRNEIHEINLDLALNDREYWIANHNQKRLYQQIEGMDIQIYYGSDFLINFCEQREKFLKNYPLLPYGLVLMYEQDWNKVKRNLKDEDIFRAPVPIFINYNLEAESEVNNFKIVHGREKEFIYTPKEFQNWYKELDTRKREMNKTMETLNQKIKNTQKLNFNIEELLQQKPSSELAEEMSDLEAEIEDVENELEDRKKELTNLLEEKEKLSKKETQKQNKLEKLKSDYNQVKEIAEETEYLNQREAQIKKVKEKLKKLEEKQEQNQNQINQNNKLQLEVNNEYNNWLKEVKRFLSELQDLFPEMEFKEPEESDSHPNYPDLYDYRDAEVNYHYQYLLDLERKEEEKNQELKYLRKERDDLKKQLLNIKSKMEDLDSEWQSFSFDIISKKELDISLEQVAENIKTRQQQRENLKEKYNIFTGKIDSKKEEIEELFQEIKARFNKTARAWQDLDLKQKEQEINSSLSENKEYLGKLEEMIAEYEDRVKHLNNLINKLGPYQLNAEKGNINNRLNKKVKNNPESLVEQWIGNFQSVKQKLKDLKNKTEDDFYEFKRDVNDLIDNDILKTSIKEKIIEDFRSDRYEYNYEILNSFKEYLHNELNSIDEDKAKAERARNQWAERSAMYVMRLIDSMQDMIKNMVYHNQRGHAFPLVRLKRTDLLPEDKDEIITELKEYFVEVIEKFKKKEVKIDNLTSGQLQEYIGDAALFSRALRGRYPVLQVYKMTEKNEFMYASPKDYYYADWESVIQGKGDISEGSGGQSLSINAFMMMMLLNYKKQRLEQDNPWSVLFLDNPFGKASAAHVLDPVFKIANKLNFQIVAFAAPEIIKTEISERFPVFWSLELNSEEGTVVGKVIYGERVRRSESTV